MNGRIYREATPEGRIAAAARSLMLKMGPFRNTPDYADFRDALGPYIEREILKAQFDEAQRSGTFHRVMELRDKLTAIEKEIKENPL